LGSGCFVSDRDVDILLHPPQSIGILLDGEDLARVLLDAAVALPDAAALTRVLEVGAEVRGAGAGAEGFGEDFQLFAVAARDGDGDGDVGVVGVGDGAVEAAGEEGAAFDGGEFFEGEGDAAVLIQYLGKGVGMEGDMYR